MDKLSRGCVGHTFDVTNDEATVEVHYKITDESFSHEFGTQVQFGYEVTSVKVYVSEVDAWVEIGKDLGKLESYIDLLIERDL